MAAKVVLKVQGTSRDVGGAPGITISLGYDFVETAEVGTLDVHVLYPLDQENVHTRLLSDVIDQLAALHHGNRVTMDEILLFGF